MSGCIRVSSTKCGGICLSSHYVSGLRLSSTLVQETRIHVSSFLTGGLKLTSSLLREGHMHISSSLVCDYEKFPLLIVITRDDILVGYGNVAVGYKPK